MSLCSIKLSAGVSHVDLDIMSALLHFTIYLIQLRARARAWVPQQGVPIFTNTEWLVTDGWWETWSVVSVHLLEVDHPLAPYLRRPMWQYIIFVIFEISLTQMALPRCTRLLVDSKVFVQCCMNLCSIKLSAVTCWFGHYVRPFTFYNLLNSMRARARAPHAPSICSHLASLSATARSPPFHKQK